MTGTIDGETVFLYNPKEGMRNEEGDTGDSTARHTAKKRVGYYTKADVEVW